MNTFNLFTTKARPFTVFAAAVISIGVMFNGCASKPPQALTTQLAKTDTSIQQAEQAGAAQGGLIELQQARDKRLQAETAMRERKYDRALQLAEQAQLDAQYASSKALSKANTRGAVETHRANEALREESERRVEESTENK